MDWTNIIAQHVGESGANFIVGVIVLLSFAISLTSCLFFCLAVRGAWRWLTRATWADVVRSHERKALR